MIRVFKSYDNKTSEITDLLKSISLSNSLTSVSRQLSCSIYYSITDRKNNILLGKMQIGAGTKIWVTLDGEEIFKGIVIDRILSNEDTLEIIAFNYAYYLNKNTITKNYNNITADSATRDILSEIGVQAGYIAPSNIKLRYLLAQKKVYDAIMELYTQVSKQTGKQYFIYMDGIKVNVGEMGGVLSNTIIKPASDPNTETCDGNLISFSYKDSMGNMINKVKIYDENNNYISQVQNNGEIAYYGILQDNYVKEKDKDATVVAKNMLHGVDREVECRVLGNWNYRTGYAVHTQIPYVDILSNAKMHIIADTHTWDIQTGEYTTELTLSFVCKMDAKESDDTQKFDTKQEKKAIKEEKKQEREKKKVIRENKRAERKAKAEAKKKQKAKKSKEKSKKKKVTPKKKSKRR
ncbi:XkdQ/YqbQ family protein [Clostridium novyi]|uniref:XkdQ/YqbQ family protein n=1 Tax=Clostridium novyi TaxID=1542 RepID=UPI0004D68E2C|nr:terminase [Clostridium novyi]KEH88889.1 Phage XkdQ-like protein [Clostridium novyi A str. GD211209]